MVLSKLLHGNLQTWELNTKIFR